LKQIKHPPRRRRRWGGEGCSQFGSVFFRMFYYHIPFLICCSNDLLGIDHRSPLPLRGLRPCMHCTDGSNPYCPFRCMLVCLLFSLFVYCGRPVLILLHKGNRSSGALHSDCGMICSKQLCRFSYLRIPPCHSLLTHFLHCCIVCR
jgi:hypothetical protein